MGGLGQPLDSSSIDGGASTCEDVRALSAVGLGQPIDPGNIDGDASASEDVQNSSAVGLGQPIDPDSNGAGNANPDVISCEGVQDTVEGSASVSGAKSTDIKPEHDPEYLASISHMGKHDKIVNLLLNKLGDIQSARIGM